MGRNEGNEGRMMNEEMRKMMYGMSRECLLVFLGKFLQIFDEWSARHYAFFSTTKDCTYSLQIKPLFLQMLEFKIPGIYTFFCTLLETI